ncbi:MAG: hypothetical protein NUV69_00185 [Candidatus Curtissbacteria bacterium]|nr:hypothetical protein [Candidatus Curtissbacteria bacterium]
MKNQAGDKNIGGIVDPQLQEDIKKLVLARIQAASDDLRIAIGSTEYTKKEMIERVEAEDEIGKEIIDIQMEYLRDTAEGAIYKLSSG